MENEGSIDWGGLGAGLGSILSATNKNDSFGPDDLALWQMLNSGKSDSGSSAAVWIGVIALILVVVVVLIVYMKRK